MAEHDDDSGIYEISGQGGFLAEPPPPERPSAPEGPAEAEGVPEEAAKAPEAPEMPPQAPEALEPASEPKGGPEAGDSETDRLLDEYRAAKPPRDDEAEALRRDAETARQEGRLDGLLSRIEENRARDTLDRARRAARQHVDEAVSVFSEVARVTPEAATDFLDGELRRDVRFLQAFTNRHLAPEMWTAVLKGKGAKLARRLADQPNPHMTADREAIRATAKLAPQAPEPRPPTGKELSEMSAEEREADRRDWFKSAGVDYRG